MAYRKLEEQMDEHLVKKAPVQIPEKGRQFIVQWAPWASLIGGVASLVAALGLWRLGHNVTYYLTEVCNGILSGYHDCGQKDLSLFYYLSLVLLVAQGVLLLAAFSGLQSRSKTRGWNLLLYGVLANVLYNVLVSFTDQGSTGNLFGAFLSALVGLYLLAQIRSYYNGVHHAEHHKPALTKDTTPKTKTIEKE
jgi:hypothetical protein